jgi:hypothetical protein
MAAATFGAGERCGGDEERHERRIGAWAIASG